MNQADIELENELDEVLGLINQELTVQETKEVTVKEDVTSFEFLIKKALGNLDTVDKTADSIHELFYHDLALKLDRSESSKQSMVEALRIKSENVKTISDIIKSIAKIKTGAEAKVGIQINTQPGSNFGIDLSKLKEEN